jgi:hypothetical protein
MRARRANGLAGALVGLLCASWVAACESDSSAPGNGGGAGGAGGAAGTSDGSRAGASASAGDDTSGAAGKEAVNAGDAGSNNADQGGQGATAGQGGSSGGNGGAILGEGGDAGAAGSGGVSDGTSKGVFDPSVTLLDFQLPDARINQPYAVTMHASGGAGQGFVFALAQGQLPPGISLDSSGVISGQALSESTATFSVRVTDSADHFNIVQLSLRAAKHRWLLYTIADGTSSQAVPTQKTALFNSSALANIALPDACTGTPSFSPDGKWLACGPLFDARDATFGNPLSLGCGVRAWSPDPNWISCGDATHSGFVDLRNPSGAVSFSIGSGCTTEQWSPRGALIGFSCQIGQNQTTYVASPHWSSPIVPLAIGLGQFMGFVSDNLVVLKASDGKVAYARITDNTATAVTELPIVAYSDVVSGLSFQANGATERAAFKINSSNEALYDFSSGQLLTASAPAVGVPGDLSHFIARDTNNLYQVFSSEQPAVALTAFPSMSEFGWTPDGKILISDGGAAHGFLATWFTPAVHSIPMAADVGMYQSLASPPSVSVLFDPASAFVIYGAQSVFDLIQFDPAATSLPNTTGGGGNALDIPAISISTSRRGFAHHGCVVGLSESYQFAGGACAPQRPAALPGLIADPKSGLLPLNRWSSDSSVMFFVDTANNVQVTGTAYGLVAVPFSDPIHPFDVVVPTVGSHGPIITTMTFAVQP